MANTTPETFMMIGPPNAGKTSLVGCLELATYRVQMRGQVSFRLFAENENTIDLFQSARQTIVHGRLPFTSSLDLKDYAFSFEIYDAGTLGLMQAVLGKGPRKFQFGVPDAPGGTVFNSGNVGVMGQSYERFKTQAKSASGLVICVDPMDKQSGVRLFLDLSSFLARLGIKPLPWRRIVIVLTKADQYFESSGREAHDRAMSETPVNRGSQLMTSPVIQGLRSYLPRGAQLGFCWASAYGFEGGASNYDTTHNGLRYFPWEPGGHKLDEGPTLDEVVQVWEPFQVLDPFLFLATGRAPGVKLLRL